MRTSLLAALLCFAAPAFASDKLIVHEWGTFTSLQDENGRAIGGMNVDDEPLPEFVHRFGPPRSSAEIFSKGVQPGHPDITMRLETPVIYFHLPANADFQPGAFDVTATFNGGMLSEFYPNAATSIDDKPTNKVPERITSSMRGGLTWKNVNLNVIDQLVPTTQSHVWNAPRKVNSSPVAVDREAEQYIFYRGVGHLEAPIKVIRSGDGNWITLYENDTVRDERLVRRQIKKPMPMWLAEFRPDGSSAFRTIKDAPAGANAKAKGQPGTFADADFAKENTAKLRAAMKTALTSEGLFDDEAEAMLETWKLSYFKGVGQRLFFMVPREWTDRVLPLTISKPSEITRVMVGRIELISPTQRLAIKQILEGEKKNPAPDLKPAYAQLGRFAVVLVSDARQREATARAGK